MPSVSPHRPALIGAFVVAGVFLAVAMVVVLGSLQLFRKEVSLVLYFDESVNGLANGANVKFRGVPIGKVSDIRVFWNQPTGSTAIPVIIQIDLHRLRNELGIDFDLPDQTDLNRQILKGLRAQLQMESLITNQLFVDLSYYPEAPKPVFYQVQDIHPEIPTIPSAFAAIGESAGDILAKFATIDIKAIGENLQALLATSQQKIDQLDLAALQASLQETSQAYRDLANSPAIPRALEEFTEALRETRQLMLSLHGRVDPLSAQAESALRELDRTLGEIRSSAAQVRLLLGPDSRMIFQLESLLRDLASLSQSGKLLLDVLERDPRAILSGKPAASAPRP